MHEAFSSFSAKTLKSKLSEVDDQMKRLQSFDGRQVIQLHCEQVELQVNQSIESAIKHLREIQENKTEQIDQYREKCFSNLAKGESQESTGDKKDLEAFVQEVGQLKEKWDDYFGRIEAYETETDIKTALGKTEEYILKMESMEERMRKQALNWQKMVFKVNWQFRDEWNHVGEIQIIAEQKHEIRQEEPKEASNPVNPTPPPTAMAALDAEKKMTIQETPSFTLTGHSRNVNQVLFLPDGKLASCSYDDTIKIWNVENGQELFQLEGHTSCVLSIALLPNGHLASGSWDKTIKIWDLEQRKEIRSIKAHSASVVSLRVLKNGNLASFSCDNTIKIWNLNSKENEPVSTMRGHGNTFFRWYQLFGALSNDYLVTCSHHNESKEECILRVWNPNKPNLIESVPTGFEDACSLLVLSNDQVALGFERSGWIKIIDPNDDVLSRTKESAHNWGVYSLAQLSNGNLISSGRDGSNWTIKVWNLIGWTLLQTINTGHSDWIRSLSISVDERFLASGSDDNTIKLWPIRNE